MLVAPAILIALFVIVRRSGNSGFLPAGAFEGKNGQLNAIMSVLLILASIVMGYALYTSYELAGDDFGKFNGVDHSMLSEFMYYHTSGSFRESSLLAFGFLVSTLGILGGLLSAKAGKWLSSLPFTWQVPHLLLSWLVFKHVPANTCTLPRKF